MKRTIIIIGLITLIVVGLLLYFSTKKNFQPPASRALEAVPIQAGLIVESRQTPDIVSRLVRINQMWQGMLEIETIHKLNKKLIFIDTLIQNNSEIEDLLTGRPVNVSVHHIGKDDLEYLFVMFFQQKKNVIDAKRNFEQTVSGYGKTSSRTYTGETIFRVNPLPGQKFTPFHYCFINGYFLLSFNDILIENSVRQVNANTSLLDDEAFDKVYKTAGKKVDANVYVNYSNLHEVFYPVLDEKYKKPIKKINGFAAWSVLDAELRKDKLLLRGFSSVLDTENHYLKQFQGLNPVHFNLINILPENTSSFLVVGAENMEKFHKNQEDYQRRTGKFDDLKKSIKLVEDSTGIDYKTLFYDIIENELGIVYTASGSQGYDTYAFIEVKNTKDATERLKELSEKYLNNQDQDIKLLIEKVETGQGTYEIYPFPLHIIPKRLFGNIFKNVTFNNFMCIKGAVIFGKSDNALISLAHKIADSNPLIEKKDYKYFHKNMAKESNFYLFSDVSYSESLYTNYFNKSYKWFWKKNTIPLNKFHAFGLQVNAEDDLFYTNFCIKYAPDLKTSRKLNWETRLNGKVSIKPALVENHYTHEDEIFVQDSEKKIYLISKEGEILWERQLEAKINSEIHQIDYFNNNKLQLLFSTSQALHLIDRNGNNVEQYPRKLQATATAGVAVFDYENNKDYRLFIPCMDRKIYCFDKTGKQVEGWIKPSTKTMITTPVQYVRVSSKDYLLAGDQSQVYILNRRGEVRVPLQTQFIKSKKNNFHLVEDKKRGEWCLKTTGKDGTIFTVYFNGKVIQSSIRDLSPAHFFEMADLNNDGQKEYIFVDKQELYVYNQKAEKMFAYDFEAAVQHPPILFHFSENNKKVGIFIKEQGKIYLFNRNGSIFSGFPINATSLFSIGFPVAYKSRTKFSLIVGTPGNLLISYDL